MIMNSHVESFEDMERYQLEPEIYSIVHLQRYLKNCSGSVPIHLKIDTGMNRLGFKEEDMENLIHILSTHPKLRVASIFTHFSSSDSATNDIFTHRQATSFSKIYEQITHVLGYFPLKHAANSPAMIRFPEYQFDMVRLGIGIYGFDPTGLMNLQPVCTLKSVVSQVKNLKQDETVGYSRIGKVTQASQVAIVPIGYADGYLRAFGNGRAKMRIGDKYFPTIGNICMDMTMIDVTDGVVEAGQEVTIFGDFPKLDELAMALDTIPYEILTNIKERIKRVYIS